MRFISFEEKFNPTRNISYKRGNVVKLNFGFNIGSEYGGLHYGVVLDMRNDHSSPVVTVIPLTSIKDGKDVHSNSVDLGNELYRLLKLKYDTISKNLKDEQTEIMQISKVFNTFLNLTDNNINKVDQSEVGTDEYDKNLADAKTSLESAKQLLTRLTAKKEHNEQEQENLLKIGSEINHMKEGSIALVNQITTISKMRIYDPRDLKGVLAGITLSEESMEKINQKVKELYVF